MSTNKNDEWVAEFDRRTNGLEFLSCGICSKCGDCCGNYDMGEDELCEAVENGSVCDEGCFSWSDCETCGSSLGGNRYDAHAFMKLNANDEKAEHLVHMNVCEDCLQYIANGTLPGEG